MEINAHLSENELAELVLNPAPAAGTHLEHCDKCLDELSRLRELFQGLREAPKEEEGFWSAQQAAVSRRIAAQKAKAPSRVGVAWAMATATIAIATILVLGGQSPSPQTPQAKIDPDHELLIEVERSLQTGGPEALEPAALLAREIGQHLNATSPNNSKETTHED